MILFEGQLHPFQEREKKREALLALIVATAEAGGPLTDEKIVEIADLASETNAYIKFLKTPGLKFI